MAAVEYEKNIITSIQEGNLESIIKLSLGSNDINRPLSLVGEVRVVNKSQKCPFVFINNPTPLIFSILCEQDLILEYFLKEKKPDFSIRINGWAPIHYACCTGDFKCLKLLLKFEYIQENIDLPIIEPIQVPEGQFSTSLHIAVTNKRHAQALLLTRELPQIEFSADGSIFDINSPTADNSSYQSSNVLQISAYGNLPLHIAAKQNDWDMCQILLHVNNDISIKNIKGQTIFDIISSHKDKEILEKIESLNLDSIENLIIKYLNENLNNEKKNELNQNNLIYEQKINELNNTITNLTQLVQQLSIRISNLENSNKNIKNLSPCQECGQIESKKCFKCFGQFCNNCFQNHQCQ